mgnify:CR=1 FL=1
MNKKPIELHAIEGTKSRTGANLLPPDVRKRIPFADWIEHPENWDKKKFIEETSDFLFDVYGIGDNQNKHTLAMLADQMETYLQCNMELKGQSLYVETNGGKTVASHPLLSIRNKSLELAIKLMNELGLTPKSRLSSNKSNDASPIDELLAGPKVA